MKADPKAEATVMSVVRQGLDAFVKRDIEKITAFYAPDPDVVVIGTGRDEKCVGPKEIRVVLERAFSQFEDASFELGWHSVSVVGSVALVSADVILAIKAKKLETSEHLRLTAVLENRGNRWLVIQWHDSVPDVRQKEGQAFAI